MTQAAKIKARITQTNIQQALQVAAHDILPVMAERVFEKGLNSRSQKLGEYSTKPIYISKAATPKIAGGRLTNKSIFYSGGYRQFKGAIGRGTRVNLRLFGVYMRDYMTAQETLSGNSITLNLKEEENSNKQEWLIEKYTDYNKFTKAERNIVQRTFTFELAVRMFPENQR